MSSTRTIRGQGEEGRGDRTRMPGMPGAPVAMGNLLKGIVPDSDHEAFLGFASKRPRLAEILAKPSLEGNDREEISAAYAVYLESKRSTALVKQETTTLATVLGVKESVVEGYLELYKPAEIRELVVVAQEQGLQPKDLVAVDAALLEDGSYIGRRSETLTVSSVHDTLTKMVNAELEKFGGRKQVEKEDFNMDKLWAVLLKEFEGNEEKAAAAYAGRAEQMIKDAKARGRQEKPYQLSTEFVVEMFKLFNYNQEDLHSLLEYIEAEFSIPADAVNPRTLVRELIMEAIGEYVAGAARTLVLNSRSDLYKSMRPVQIRALEEEGFLGTGKADQDD
jgi:hypothetical protein